MCRPPPPVRIDDGQAILSRLDPGFFERSDALARDAKGPFPFERLQADMIGEGLASSYDVRSHLSHEGKVLVTWMSPHHLAERMHGRPHLPGEERWADAVAGCLSHIGLERVLRYAMFKALDEMRAKYGGVASPPLAGGEPGPTAPSPSAH
jgi:hypothetical protein